ncbi:uncharacterized protein LOC112969942, partial [Apteryx rowi]|uniref:uncharacterized protein LOC112969942 n=1 Tax=Apteryx rowi TaxID=308060 RepID=UPI000E1D2288
HPWAPPSFLGAPNTFISLLSTPCTLVSLGGTSVSLLSTLRHLHLFPDHLGDHLLPERHAPLSSSWAPSPLLSTPCTLVSFRGTSISLLSTLGHLHLFPDHLGDLHLLLERHAPLSSSWAPSPLLSTPRTLITPRAPLRPPPSPSRSPRHLSVPPQTKAEEEEIDRTPWGELEPSDEESSEEEEEEESDEEKPDETGFITPADSGLITPGGFSSVPAGMETPELIELRKKKIEEAMDG